MDKSVRRSLEEASKECEPPALTIQNFCTEILHLNIFYIGPFVSVACGIEVRRQEEYFLNHQMERGGGGEKGCPKDGAQIARSHAARGMSNNTAGTCSWTGRIGRAPTAPHRAVWDCGVECLTYFLVLYSSTGLLIKAVTLSCAYS